MNKRHPDCQLAIYGILKCVYFEYQSNVDAVKESLLDGGCLQKQPMTLDNIDELKLKLVWKEYRKYIQI